MEFEFYRNNARYTASIEHPLVFTGETKIEKGGGSLSPIAVFENKVYAASGTYLVCFDLNTKAVIWERESGTEISTPIDGGNNLQFPPLKVVQEGSQSMIDFLRKALDSV